MSLTFTFNDIKKHVASFSPKQIDSLGNDPSSCWVGAHFHLTQFNIIPYDTIDIDHLYTQTVDVDQLLELIDSNDIVHCAVENDFEIHYFTIITHINKDNNCVNILHTYGGINKYMNDVFNKDKWINMMKHAYLGDSHSYRDVFSINPTISIPDDIGNMIIKCI